MSITQIVEYELKRLLGNDWETKIDDEDIEFAVNKATQHFLGYTNQPRVPKGAEYVIGDMVIALLKMNFSELFDNEQSDQDLLAKLGAINVGDTSLSFGTSKLTPTEIIGKENAMFYTFKSQMKPFRKMAVPTRGN